MPPMRFSQQTRDNLLSKSVPITIYNSAASLVAMPVPIGNLYSIGWMADISRADAEDKLKSSPGGDVFMMRFSRNADSYVLSYRQGSKISHIAYIHPADEGRVSVDRDDGTTTLYRSLHAYIEAMQLAGIIGDPFIIDDFLIAF